MFKSPWQSDHLTNLTAFFLSQKQSNYQGSTVCSNATYWSGWFGTKCCLSHLRFQHIENEVLTGVPKLIAFSVMTEKVPLSKSWSATPVLNYFWAHLCLCTVGSYASLSVCPSVWCHWTKIQNQEVIHLTSSTVAGMFGEFRVVDFLSLQIASLRGICRWAHFNVKVHFLVIFTGPFLSAFSLKNTKIIVEVCNFYISFYKRFICVRSNYKNQGHCKTRHFDLHTYANYMYQVFFLRQ